MTNQASTNTATADGTAQTNTLCTACEMAKNTSSRIVAGSRLTVTGLNWPPAAFRRTPGARARISAVRFLAKITPKIDTPIDPPICWKNVRELLATPMSRGSTLFCTMIVVMFIRKPMPMPSTAK